MYDFLNKEIKASYTVESSVVMSACIILMAAVIMFGITLREKMADMCRERYEDEIRCIDVMNGRDAELEKTYERAPEILYKERAIKKVVD